MPLSVNRLRSRGTSSPENVQLGEVLVCSCIVDTVRRVGKSLFKTLGHPPKERFDRSFRRRSVGRRFFRDDSKPVYKYLTGTLRGEDLPPIMEDNGGLAKTGPRMLTS